MQSLGRAVARTARILATSPAFLARGAVGGDHKRTRGHIVAGVGAETSLVSGHGGCRGSGDSGELSLGECEPTAWGASRCLRWST
jgi:hypothetical protein